MLSVFSILFLVCSLSVFGQVKVSKTDFDYGKVVDWHHPLDSIVITNNSSQPIQLLITAIPRGFQMDVPKEKIQPGDSATVRFIYQPRITGKFKESIQVYHSQSSKPIVIKLKGDIRSFAPDADIACPTFTSGTRKQITFDLKINVIDSVTKQPIDLAEIEISKGENWQSFLTDKQGQYSTEATLGLYFMYVGHQKYYSKELEYYFNPNQKEITIELAPKPIEIVEQPAEDSAIVFVVDTIIDENPDFSSSLYKRNNIVFLIDISSSMKGHDRLPLLKESMIELTKMLRSTDQVTIITYAKEVEVRLKPTSADNKEEIISVIENLKSSGSTEGGKAIKKAYKVAHENYIEGGNNQIYLATDGGFNGLNDTKEELYEYVEEKSETGIHFSILAFGKNKYGKQLLLNIAEHGKGTYLYINDSETAKVGLNQMVRVQSKNL